MYEIEFYETENKKCKVREFLAEMDDKLQGKVAFEIGLLRDYGPTLEMPHCRYLKNGIYELRPKIGKNHARILYFFFKDGKIVLTNGFIKKTQKTPQKEIELALKYRADYLIRNSN